MRLGLFLPEALSLELGDWKGPAGPKRRELHQSVRLLPLRVAVLFRSNLRLSAGGHREAAIPVPIPNTEVKRLFAEGSAGPARARVGRRRLFYLERERDSADLQGANPVRRSFLCEMDMSWTCWILASAFFLALYDLAKKASVRENAVLPVLLCSTSFGCAIFVLAVALHGDTAAMFHVGGEVLFLALSKSVIVATSWVFTFCALRTLPITLATPIRASAPAMVFVWALFLYGEVPGGLQALGMIVTFAGYWAFSWAGRHEGVDFFRNRAVWCAIAGACWKPRRSRP